MMLNNHYNKNLKNYARELRTNSVSKAEKLLWKAVLSRKQMGIKFKRQRPISFYIVDFFAEDIGLIIEIDGNSHWAKPEYDARRQKHLETLGYTFIRFKESEVLGNLDDVVSQLEHAIYCLTTEE